MIADRSKGTTDGSDPGDFGRPWSGSVDIEFVLETGEGVVVGEFAEAFAEMRTAETDLQGVLFDGDRGFGIAVVTLHYPSFGAVDIEPSA